MQVCEGEAGKYTDKGEAGKYTDKGEAEGASKLIG